ncbi:MAG: transketolase [Ardenticatenaceae bacterium]|nr:transketolase [Ardenticatenaceae bacterium]
MTQPLASALKPIADTIRVLVMDAVQRANSGHPGMPMGMADVASLLWAKYLKFDPRHPQWPDRDRFILSAGHGSMLLYALLHLSGYDLPMEELQNFRQWGSRTPGHPEHGHTVGVETTTGPLGQGISNAVGFAMAEQWLAQKFNRPEFPMVDHRTFVIAGDGDLMEGISHEAAALAGHLGLSKLIVLYDDNGISIDGKTTLAFTEDVLARFAAYGWHAARADGHDVETVKAALDEALADEERPSLIACRTIIGFGSPNRAGTSKAHGEPLGEEEIRLTRENLGLPQEKFWTDPRAYELLGTAGTLGAAKHHAWSDLLAQYEAAYPELAAEFKRMMHGELPQGWEAAAMPEFGKPIATRAASGQVLNAFARVVPELLGGSADLTGSNKTDLKGEADVQKGHWDGRYLRFGVREHGMGAIMNGMALHGGIIPYGGTFLVFSDYMRPAVRLAALMEQQVIYVFTHDSIGLGEDGPTHQPIEQLAALRAIPNLVVLRPADAWETAVAWQTAIARRNGPTALALTRQNLPVLDRAVAQGAAKGGYVLADAANPQVILLGSGSEVQIALDAQKLLAEKGVSARVVSMPSWELFDAQPQDYRDSVLPPTVTARVAIEAGVTLGWQRYVGSDGAVIGIDHFGASAPFERIYAEFGLTPQAMVAAALEMVG